jgi:acyl-[acyl carrier protein]--UDP-N-acetylglucosamine O-acyltransferase
MSLRSAGRYGARFSILANVELGSCVSVRNLLRTGSAFSMSGERIIIDRHASVLNYFTIASSISLRQFAKCGSSLSIHTNVLITRKDFLVSVTQEICLGSAVSLRYAMRPSSGISILNTLNLGSSVSVRSAGSCTRCFGDKVSMANMLAMGSSLSIRQFVRMGSAYSFVGKIHYDKCRRLSTFDKLVMGSSVSVRSRVRFGSRLSIGDAISVGSSLSIRCFARAGSGLSVQNNCRISKNTSVMC